MLYAYAVCARDQAWYQPHLTLKWWNKVREIVWDCGLPTTARNSLPLPKPAHACCCDGSGSGTVSSPGSEVPPGLRKRSKACLLIGQLGTGLGPCASRNLARKSILQKRGCTYASLSLAFDYATPTYRHRKRLTRGKAGQGWPVIVHRNMAVEVCHVLGLRYQLLSAVCHMAHCPPCARAPAAQATRVGLAPGETQSRGQHRVSQEYY